MSYNAVIADVIVPAHAAVATVALVLGGYNLGHRPKGDRAHRRVGRIWVAAMYATVLSSFLVRELRPGHFSWIHGLSVFTFGTLTIGVWAALTGRVQLHRRFITGSYLGLWGAFLGAVAVPSRRIPQWLVHQPLGLVLAAVACLALALAVIAPRRRPAFGREAGSGRETETGSDRETETGSGRETETGSDRETKTGSGREAVFGRRSA